VGERCEFSSQVQLTAFEGKLQGGDELAAEHAAEHVAWEEEVVARVNPAEVIGRKSSGWDYAMNVRVMTPTPTIP
jgi:hypothetical protein